MNRTLELIRTAYTMDQMTTPEGPHIAMAGRSNVGKSTLINCLAGRKALAKISSTPGKTRSVNFYQITDTPYHLVDLPGYGYAKRSKSERDTWSKLIDNYLKTEPAPKAVVLLIDSRIPPQRLDMDLAAYVMGLSIPLLPVLTKIDKCKQKEVNVRQKEWKNILRADFNLMTVSGKTGKGRDELWDEIMSLFEED